MGMINKPARVFWLPLLNEYLHYSFSLRFSPYQFNFAPPSYQIIDVADQNEKARNNQDCPRASLLKSRLKQIKACERFRFASFFAFTRRMIFVNNIA